MRWKASCKSLSFNFECPPRRNSANEGGRTIGCEVSCMQVCYKRMHASGGSAHLADTCFQQPGNTGTAFTFPALHEALRRKDIEKFKIKSN